MINHTRYSFIILGLTFLLTACAVEQPRPPVRDGNVIIMTKSVSLGDISLFWWRIYEDDTVLISSLSTEKLNEIRAQVAAVAAVNSFTGATYMNPDSWREIEVSGIYAAANEVLNKHDYSRFVGLQRAPSSDCAVPEFRLHPRDYKDITVRQNDADVSVFWEEYEDACPNIADDQAFSALFAKLLGLIEASDE